MSKKNNERAAETLNAIELYNNDHESMINDGSSLLATFHNGDDSQDRLDSVKCSEKMMGSLKELSYLDNYTENTKISKWLKTEDVYLPNYAPEISVVKSSDGEELPSTATDFKFIHKILKTFGGGPRGNHLQTSEDFFYDDDYILQRTITKFNKNKLEVMKIPLIGDFSTSEYETRKEPFLPSENELLNFYNKDYGSHGGALRLAEILVSLEKNKESEYPNFLNSGSYNSIHNVEQYFKDENSSKEYANEIINKAPETIYYMNPDDGTYMIAVLKNKKVEKYEHTIKNVYKSYYQDANDITKYYIYNNKNYQDEYMQYKFRAVLVYEIQDNNVTDKDAIYFPTKDVEESKYSQIITSYKNKLLKQFNLAKSAYETNNENSRCEECEAASEYPRIYDHMNELLTNSYSQCSSFIKYIDYTVQPWINRRENSLNNYMLDEDNVKKMLKLLKKRLTKNSGSLLIWYQSLLHIDDTYEKLNITKELALDETKKSIVTRAYVDGGNENELFNVQDYPNYIDIQDLDPIYNDTFKVNDYIYILDGVMREYIAKITGITTVDIKKMNMDALDVDKLNNGDIEGSMETTIPVTRLNLDTRLPKWCKVENPYNILIMKKVN